MADPTRIQSAIVDGVAVDKGGVRAAIDGGTVQVYDDPADLLAKSPGGQWIIYVKSLQTWFRKATEDTSVSNGTTVLTDGDGVTWLRLDTLLTGNNIQVRAATTANIAIATALNNGDTLDGVVLATADLVLVKDQTAPAENGIYVVGVTPARTAAFDTYDEHVESLVSVKEGAANASTLWICSANAGGTLDTTAIPFTKIVVPAPGAASQISNTPAGGIAATNVQAAIDELDTEKASTGKAIAMAMIFG